MTICCCCCCHCGGSVSKCKFSKSNNQGYQQLCYCPCHCGGSVCRCKFSNNQGCQQLCQSVAVHITVVVLCADVSSPTTRVVSCGWRGSASVQDRQKTSAKSLPLHSSLMVLSVRRKKHSRWLLRPQWVLTTRLLSFVCLVSPCFETSFFCTL